MSCWLVLLLVVLLSVAGGCWESKIKGAGGRYTLCSCKVDAGVLLKKAGFNCKTSLFQMGAGIA